MKSLPGNIGNINLKGKKGKLPCGCCYVQNLKEKTRAAEANKEIDKALNNWDHDYEQ